VLRPGGSAIVAASLGPATPFYTPDPILTRRFARHGLTTVATGEAGQGTYHVARMSA